MMAPGFRPVGWVAGVAASAIGCYMLSLNVASERAELLKIERQIVATKQDIRALQTELGTRGRLAQLEQWNADVLALAAPATPQFLENELKLARFDKQAPTLEERAEVRLAAAEASPKPAPKLEAPVLKASVPEAPMRVGNPLVHKASLAIPAAKPQPAAAVTASSAKTVKVAAPAKPAAKPASVDKEPVKPIRLASSEERPASRIDAGLARQIAAAARLEESRGGPLPGSWSVRGTGRRER